MSCNYIVIENESIARDRLVRVIESLRPDMNLIAVCGSIRESVKLLNGNSHVDLIFMDIELADGNCFEIFDEVKVTVPIIFTTAYNDFALRAFEVYSLDYLLKPISEMDMKRALDKFDRIEKKEEKNWNQVTKLIENDMKSRRQRILAVSGDTFSYINLSDVAMFEVEDGYIFAVLHDGHKRMPNFTSLPEVMERVDGSNFFQVSRSRVINIECIVKVSKYFRGRLLVKFKIGDKIEEETVSALRRQEFLNWLGQ